MLSSKSAGKNQEDSTGLKASSFCLTISPTAYSRQSNRGAQSLGYRSHDRAWELHHTLWPLQAPRLSLFSGAGSTWA